MRKLILYFKILSWIALLGMRVAYGMQENFSSEERVQENMESWIESNDILKLLTIHLYRIDYLNLSSFGRSINALIQVNKVFNIYYSDEQRVKGIVRVIPKLKGYSSERDIARNFLPTGVFKRILNKIDYLFNIVDQNKDLTEDDLRDSWFIDATKYVHYDDQPGETFRKMVVSQRRSTMLAEACRKGQRCNVAMLIHGGSNIEESCLSLLIEIVQERNRIKDVTTKKDYLIIAQLLLEKGMDPNYRYWSRNPNALMVAVNNTDKEFVEVLLAYNADPNQKGLSRLLEMPAFCSEGNMKEYFKDDPMEDTFQMEQGEPKGWLKGMVDEIATRDKK